jgi:WD40-like Beta Propeller Repeat
MYDTHDFTAIRARGPYVSITPMRRIVMWGSLALVACEAHITGGALRDGGDVDDGGLDAAPLGPWSTPTKVSPAATLATEDDVTLSGDALEAVWAIQVANGKDLYYASRPAIGAPWSLATRLPFSGDAASEETPRFSPDDITLYFSSDRDNGRLDIYGVSRPKPGSTEWSGARPLDDKLINSLANVEKWFAVCTEGYYVMAKGGGGSTDLVEGKLGSGVEPKPITVLNTDDTETGAWLSRDCLTLYFASTRTDPELIYSSHRASVDAPWGPPTPMRDFAALGGDQEDPWLSPDGRTFVFASSAGGNKDIYLSTR